MLPPENWYDNKAIYIYTFQSISMCNELMVEKVSAAKKVCEAKKLLLCWIQICTSNQNKCLVAELFMLWFCNGMKSYIIVFNWLQWTTCSKLCDGDNFILYLNSVNIYVQRWVCKHCHIKMCHNKRMALRTLGIEP